MALDMLCQVALSQRTRTNHIVHIVPVYNPMHKTVVHMDLGKYPYKTNKGGITRVTYFISPKLIVKLYVLTCKQQRTENKCRACFRNSHHKCESRVFVHVLQCVKCKDVNVRMQGCKDMNVGCE